MFEKIRRQLTIIYMLIFSTFLIVFAFASFEIVLMALTREITFNVAEMVKMEAQEYAELGVHPLLPKTLAEEQAFAYLLDNEGKVILNQMGSGELAQKLIIQKQEWVDAEDHKELIFLEKANGERGVFIAGQSPVIKNGTVVGTLYIFRNLTRYYEASTSAAKIIAILILLFLAIAGYIGYYLAGKNLLPIKTAFQKQKEFVADASHELRTPLAVLTIATEAIEADEDSHFSPFAREVFANVKTEIKAINKLTGTLLTLARADDKGLILVKEEASINGLVAEVLTLLQPLAYKNQLEINYQQSEQIVCKVDKEKIKQLVTIIVDNAIKYSLPQNQITVSLAVVSKEVVLTIADAG
ncbi:MAG: HAMP domain-containing sensor histidine kinase, partial [Acidaminococcaceae bacterium]